MLSSKTDFNAGNLKSRIAPTPSGYLHLGNVYSFLTTWLLTRKFNGQLLLRIDDLDAQRMRPNYLDHIFHTLQWLNLKYDEGPRNSYEFYETFSQKHRLALYNQYLDRLKESGKVFACLCTRKSLSKEKKCSCKQKHIPFEEPGVCWRIQAPENTTIEIPGMPGMPNQSFPLGQQMNNWVVRRRDGLPAYQIASLADDLFYGVNFIVRGEDLLPSSAAQIYMAKILGEDAFDEIVFFHHRLLKGLDGQKLSKSSLSPAFQPWVQMGNKTAGFLTSISSFFGIANETPIENLADFSNRFQQSNNLFI